MMVDDEKKTRMSQSVPDPLVGRTIDGYEIQEIIGRGGMGVVYKAVQQSLGRPVAIKVLPEDVTENRQFLDRFEREIDVLARLSHPNIVTVFERGVVDGRPYIAMELVEGTTLRDVMRKGPLPQADALILVRSILSALEHAHEKGIIHRDIKPENVLVAPGGIVKVADFGLSRHLEGENATRLTKTYVALGTFEYMSPEQREMARDADARSDLYATGVVLYEMIAGELPIGSFEPLSRMRPTECDGRIDEVVERSLKKAPSGRWQDARQMGDAVSRLLSAPAATLTGAGASDQVTEPKWKRVLSNIFGREFPVCRIEGRMPSKFAERTLEDVTVQRWLGSLLTLWPQFPGGVSFSKQSKRLVLEFECRWGDDPIRDKRLAAAVGAVLEANSGGKLVRITVADAEFEALIGQPPVLGAPIPKAPRPSKIDEQSVLMSGVQRVGPQQRPRPKTSVVLVAGIAAVVVSLLVLLTMGTSGGGVPVRIPIVMLGLGVAALGLVALVARANRGLEANYRLSFMVTVMWVGIFLAANWGSMHYDEVIWLCIGAAASVYLLPRLPAFFASIGRTVVWIVVSLLVMALVMGFLLMGVRVENQDADVARTLAAPRRDTSGRFAEVVGELPRGFAAKLLGNPKIENWIVTNMPSARELFGPGGGIHESAGFVSLSLPSGWNAGDFEERTAILGAFAIAAKDLAPSAIQRLSFPTGKWKKKLAESKPNIVSLEAN